MSKPVLYSAFIPISGVKVFLDEFSGCTPMSAAVWVVFRVMWLDVVGQIFSEVVFGKWMPCYSDENAVVAVFTGVSWSYVIDSVLHAFAVLPSHVLCFCCGCSSAVLFFRFGDNNQVVVYLYVFEFE